MLYGRILIYIYLFFFCCKIYYPLSIYIDVTCHSSYGNEYNFCLLTTSRWTTCKHANYFRATERRASEHAFQFLCVSTGRLVYTARVVCHDRRVCTPSFLGVPGVTVGWPRTEGTANNERVHSFCGFLPNPKSKTCAFDVPAKNL